jgi:hypothetical protein
MSSPSAQFSGHAAPPELTSTPGPLARAIAREAVPPAVDSQTGASDRQWSRVQNARAWRRDHPDDRRFASSQRYVVLADESELLVLNVSDPALPADAAEVLRGVDHPAYVSAVHECATFVLAKGVRRRARASRNGAGCLYRTVGTTR